MSEDTQHLISKVRPPRVQITYDVEIGNAIQVKELPFVVGILADLSGDRDPNATMPSVKQRKFVEIDRDNFNDVMAQISPRIATQVKNVLPATSLPANTPFEFTLTFNNIDAFGPVQIIQQIPVMNALYQVRTKLHDLLIKMDGNQELEEFLQQLMTNPASVTQLKKDIAQATAAAAKAAPTSKPSAPKKS